ncbi:unnamed protein product [Parnassius apollo]|uniref:(apollo) hypothetical protein n=1 Tax=Parnassius apollo TaxID=110799 RepID=A0A8S3WWX6_PARAO|nr:unnamed protein product [Parnassius apollo]
MDSEQGPSGSKRQRKQMFYVTCDSDIEEELYGTNSEDDFQPDEENSASESEGGKDTEVTEKGLAEKVVMQPLQEKLNNGHEICMDNYYNSFSLAKKLLDNNTYCTGTLRKDLKENPLEIVQKTLKKGENCSMFQAGVHVGKGKDKRPVLYITTQYEDGMVPVAKKRGQITHKSEAISKYNDYMSRVDRHYQLLSFYPCERKTTLVSKGSNPHVRAALHQFNEDLQQIFRAT